MAEEFEDPETAEAVEEDPEALIFDNIDDEPAPVLDIPEYVEADEEPREVPQQEQKPDEEAAAAPLKPEEQTSTEPVATEEPPPAQTPSDDQEAPQQPKAEAKPAEFRLREQTDDFLQQDVEPDIPSQVSQLTLATTAEYEPSVKGDQVSARMQTAIALSKIDEESRRVSGDFAVLPTVTLGSKTSIESYQTEMEMGSEESAPVIVEVAAVLDREPYYKLHNEITTELVALKIKNNFLQKKMVEYFKKRKMEHVFKETEQYVDTQHKYYKRLDTLDELLQMDQSRRLVINTELGELKKDRNEKLNFIRTTMKQLLEREKDISTGLIHTKTGKEIPEKVIERLLKRQYFAVEQVAEHRLKYIKIRNRVTEKQLALQEVDKLGDNLRLVDYEQLKIEHRGYADKVEERDEELTKLRIKCDGIFQVLAHLREKSAAATLDIIKEQQVLHAVGIESMEARERTNYFKIERDRYRNMTNKLREETGILFKPTLLRDMENAIHESKSREFALNEVKEKQKTQLMQLRAIRKNIEVATNYKALEKATNVRKMSSKLFAVHKKKPTVMKKPASVKSKLKDV